jgi:hypothetical protein
MTIDCGGEGSRKVHEAWVVFDLKTETAEIRAKRRPPCGERNLGQKPEGVKESRPSTCRDSQRA